MRPHPVSESPGTAVSGRPAPIPRPPLSPMAGGVISSEPVALAPATLEALRLITVYAPAETPVVLVGATGTGKSYFARLLHELSGRRGPFEDMGAGELDEHLARDQLFGHRRGGFTGAVGDRLGLIRAAGSGTVLLDDFHLAPRWLQYALLRLFDRGAFKPVGVDRDGVAGCRLVVGIGDDPDRLVAQGELLADLRYRLGHCFVRLPELVQRREEIAAFAHRFLAEAPGRTKVLGGPREFASGVTGLLEAGAWPGNLRDLREAVHRAYVHARGSQRAEIMVEDLPEEARVSIRYDRRGDLDTKLRLVRWALWRTGGHVGRAAELIGAHRNTVGALMERLRIERGGSGALIKGQMKGPRS